MWVYQWFVYVYPVDDVREAISQPVELAMSFHGFVQQALKYPVTIEQRGNSSFISLRLLILYFSLTNLQSINSSSKKIKFCAKDFEFFLTLIRWVVSTG